MKKINRFIVTFSLLSSIGSLANAAQTYSLSDQVQKSMAITRGALFTEAWEESGDPVNIDKTKKYNYTLSLLPKAASLKVSPWSDSYWPSYKGGISYRWQLGDEESTSPSHTTYPSYPSLTLLKEKPEMINLLSPAEKFDIYVGDFNYTLTKSEEERVKEAKADPENRSWEGLCHAWAPASYLFVEPSTVKLKSKDGLEISFYSSDVKALLIYAQHSSENCYNQAGIRCQESDARSSRAFRDINPGSFHVILTNEIGIHRRGFVFDRDAHYQVWNQPAFEYKVLSMTEIAKDKLPSAALSYPLAEGAVKFFQVQTRVIYGQEVVPSKKKTGTTSEEKIYDYILDVNANGKIIGGSWLGDSIKDHPDFVWTQDPAAEDNVRKELHPIFTIYNKAHGAHINFNDNHPAEATTVKKKTHKKEVKKESHQVDNDFEN